MERGHSHRRAVVLMYVWSALVSFGVIALGRVQSLRVGIPVVGGLVVVAVVLSILTLGRPARSDRQTAR